MTGRETPVGCFKAIAGTMLAGLGMFILYEELAAALERLRYILGANGSETGGRSAGIQALQAWQGYVAAHQPFLQSFLQSVLESSWPLLLVLVGAVLARDILMNNMFGDPRKDGGLVDSATRRSTSD